MTAPLRARMQPRDPGEHHRVATPLELFFDLAFVVAVAQCAAALHHGLVEGHAGEVVPLFVPAFFAIWWAWMNFTWFASAYDCDDAVYRAMTFLQMTGVLVLAAGLPRVFDDLDVGVGVAGYVLMRLAMVGQWLRAARAHPERRATALRYAGGIAAVQVGWVLRFVLVPHGAVGVALLVVLGALELAVPAWAEKAGDTPWHPHHITERYGLFTIIVLGESILAGAIGVQQALDTDVGLGPLAPTIVGGLLLVFGMWWVYFDLPRERVTDAMRASFDDGRRSMAFLWGYGHYVVFAAIAAAGAGLAVAVDRAVHETAPDPEHHFELGDVAAGAAVTLPVAVYVLVVWLLHRAHKEPTVLPGWLVPFGAAVLLALTFTPEPALFSGLALAAVVVAHALAGNRLKPAGGA